jgi:putative membrane protein
MMWWYGAPGSGMFAYGGWWAGHMIVMALFWLVFVALAVMAVQRFGSSRGQASDAKPQDAGILSAVTILQERYAKGEIGREEFMQKRRDLGVAPYRDETPTEA